jgi:hypothetical protein
MARYAFTRGADREHGFHATYDIIDHGPEPGRMDVVLARGAGYEQARVIVDALNNVSAGPVQQP